MKTVILQQVENDYNTIVLTIVLILILGRMIDKFVNDKDR